MSRAFVSDGWQRDGHPHERDENGFCGNCGARKGEYHYALKPTPQAAVYAAAKELAAGSGVVDFDGLAEHERAEWIDLIERAAKESAAHGND